MSLVFRSSAESVKTQYFVCYQTSVFALFIDEPCFYNLQTCVLVKSVGSTKWIRHERRPVIRRILRAIRSSAWSIPKLYSSSGSLDLDLMNPREELSPNILVWVKLRHAAHCNTEINLVQSPLSYYCYTEHWYKYEQLHVTIIQNNL